MQTNEITSSRRYTPEKAMKAFATYGPAGDPDGIQGSRAVRTECQYASAWAIYSRWCDGAGLTPMPASAEQLLAFRHAPEVGLDGCRRQVPAAQVPDGRASRGLPADWRYGPLGVSADAWLAQHGKQKPPEPNGEHS
jgi:hypothetical protein